MKELLYEELGKEKTDIVFCLLKGRIGQGKILDFKIIGNSMSPFLSRGDTVLVRTVEFQDLQKGDIIVYRINKYLCAHRYIYSLSSSLSNGLHRLRKDDNPFALIVKADNRPYFDQLPVFREQLLGKVSLIRKNKKTINLETALWKITNYLLANISATHAYIPLSLQFLRRIFLPNKKFPYGRFIDSGLSLFFSSFFRLIICPTKILPWFYKKV